MRTYKSSSGWAHASSLRSFLTRGQPGLQPLFSFNFSLFSQMFARIYPLLRLPRRFGVFDYQIPEGMHVDIGDMVRIPFHGRTAYGIVAKLSETTDVLRNISDVSEVTWKCALSTGDVTRIEALAASIVQNPSTLLFHIRLIRQRHDIADTRHTTNRTACVITCHCGDAWRRACTRKTLRKHLRRNVTRRRTCACAALAKEARRPVARPRATRT